MKYRLVKAIFTFIFRHLNSSDRSNPLSHVIPPHVSAFHVKLLSPFRILKFADVAGQFMNDLKKSHKLIKSWVKKIKQRYLYKRA